MLAHGYEEAAAAGTLGFTEGGWSGQAGFSLAAIPGMFAAIPFAIWFFLALGLGYFMLTKGRRDDAAAMVPVAATSG